VIGSLQDSSEGRLYCLGLERELRLEVFNWGGRRCGPLLILGTALMGCSCQSRDLVFLRVGCNNGIG
jgi:hypothetical protein